MSIPDISESLETIVLVKILQFFDADPDLGWKNSDPGCATLNPGFGSNFMSK
jgi:hypothetical protein